MILGMYGVFTENISSAWFGYLSVPDAMLCGMCYGIQHVEARSSSSWRSGVSKRSGLVSEGLNISRELGLYETGISCYQQLWNQRKWISSRYSLQSHQYFHLASSLLALGRRRHLRAMSNLILHFQKQHSQLLDHPMGFEKRPEFG
jgi:hypothetical protein